MLFHLALLAAVAPFGTFASPFDAKHSNGLRIRQDEAVAVDVPTDTELDTTEPEDIDPHTDVENVEMIGDLRNGATTPVGNSIMNILLGREKAETRFERAYRPPGSLKSKACKADTCCVWSHISTAMTTAFTGHRGQCNNLARAAIRLGFHDAGTWSLPLALSGQDFGGADGSIILSPTELSRPENRGLQQIASLISKWQKIYPVSMADLIQFAAIHAVVTCPLGPRIRFFAGRIDSSVPALDNLLPSHTASAASLLALFKDKTISPHELTALLGAHSTSTQRFVDPSKAGRPQDSTPGVWDVKYYNETIQTVPKRVFRFESDVKLAAHPEVKGEWERFVDPVEGQDHWNADYATAYTRLSLLGVNNINNLTECTHVLPREVRDHAAFSGRLLRSKLGLSGRG